MLLGKHRGKLLYKGSSFKLYMNGIKPSPFYLTLAFIPYEHVVGIWKIVDWPNAYLIHFDHPPAIFLRCRIFGWGYSFGIQIPTSDIKKVLGILKERIGERWKDVYKTDKVLVWDAKKDMVVIKEAHIEDKI